MSINTEQILQAMEIITSSQEVMSEKIITCKVLEVIQDVSTGIYKYLLGYDSVKFYIESSEKFDVNNELSVSVPNGDFSEDKTIIGKVSSNTEERITYAPVDEDFIEVENLKLLNGSESLVIGETEPVYRVIESLGNNPSLIHTRSFFDTYQFDYIRLQFSLGEYEFARYKGVWGIEVNFYCIDNEDVISTINLPNTLMSGNPYINLDEDPFNYYFAFPKDKIEDYRQISKIELKLYQNSTSFDEEDIQEKITIEVSNVSLAFGYSQALQEKKNNDGISKLNKANEGVLLLQEGEELEYNEKISDNNTRHLQARFIEYISSSDSYTVLGNANKNDNIYWCYYDDGEYQSKKEADDLILPDRGLYWNILRDEKELTPITGGAITIKLRIQGRKVDSYKAISYQKIEGENPIETNALNFQNVGGKEYQPPVPTGPTLNIELSCGDSDSYNIYGYDDRLVNSNKIGSNQHTATFSIINSEQMGVDENRITEIHWYLSNPKKGSLIQHNSSATATLEFEAGSEITAILEGLKTKNPEEDNGLQYDEENKLIVDQTVIISIKDKEEKYEYRYNNNEEWELLWAIVESEDSDIIDFQPGAIFIDGKLNNSIPFKFASNYIASSKTTIECKIITQDGLSYYGKRSLTFGHYGNQGTGYRLVLTPRKTALEMEKNATMSIEVELQDLEGMFKPFTLSKEDNVEWLTGGVGIDILSVTKLNDEKWLITLQFTGKTIVVDQNDGTSTTFTTKDPEHYCYSILKVVVPWASRFRDGTSSNINLTSYLPIPLKKAIATTSQNSGEYYSHISGTTSILYTAENPSGYYNSNDYYQLFNEGGAAIEDLNWELISNNPNNAPTLYQSEKDQNYRIQKIQFNLTGTIAVAVIASKNNASPIDVNNQVVVSECEWIQPILITNTSYGNEIIDNWSGALEINEGQNYILSAMMGAGKKDMATNTFTGVLMGAVGELGTDGKIGLYGFQNNKKHFYFTEDGEAYIGNDTGCIRFDNGRFIVEGIINVTDGGTVGGMTVRSDRIFTPMALYGSDGLVGAGINKYGVGPAFWAGSDSKNVPDGQTAQFRVYHNGSMVATSGYIGDENRGWTIKSDALYNQSNTNGRVVLKTQDDVAFAAGVPISNSYNETNKAKLQIWHNGTIKAGFNGTDYNFVASSDGTVNIKGVITASGGKIGPRMTITSNGLYYNGDADLGAEKGSIIEVVKATGNVGHSVTVKMENVNAYEYQLSNPDEGAYRAGQTVCLKEGTSVFNSVNIQSGQHFKLLGSALFIMAAKEGKMYFSNTTDSNVYLDRERVTQLLETIGVYNV